MSKMIEAAAAAFQFLSRLPVRREIPFTPEVQQRSVVFYPFVGAVIGVIVAVLGLGLSFVLPSFPAAVILLAAWVALTGGLHLDGWMDSADALLSHRSRERMLEIMKDSRVGAMGVMACMLLLLLKASLIMSVWDLSEGVWKQEAWLLVLAPVWSRWFMVHAMYRWPMARGSEGLAALFHGLSVRRRSLAGIVAILLTLVVIGLLWCTTSTLDLAAIGIGGILVIPLAAWAVGSLTAERMSRRLGGLTGDTYGALNEWIETIVLILVVLLLKFT
ncbi:adenosylcobinamide-GDP ribazoletransferase [Paenibacillus sp. BR1-192]|uniref:adenosylcobinamide-GDP ribazoletransferase n=1 Tax=Paenibacillus sp. BR1-192 TaxID=3032287 RepID=UPI00240D058D|nr:adenosylcobinamide-GDP ribazoletransferase [Paenibacillus sp. BR1-192]WFB57406.1 adenosylcobinamide-GDP ribazoletransferase [Paenibacillus sp. BR1-192]